MSTTAGPHPQALHRFYDAAGALLYVGITLDPAARWRQHRDDKPWWTQVARITLDTYPDRATVLQAERAAIIAEQPRYNVVHNRGTLAEPRNVAQLDRLTPFQVGDWIALGLRDGRCPVGEIAATDDTWISIRLKNFLYGTIDHHAIAVRWKEVERVELAYPEDAVKFIYDDPWGAARIMDDRHLGDHKDPVDQAASEARHERSEARERRQ